MGNALRGVKAGDEATMKPAECSSIFVGSLPKNGQTRR